MLNPTKHEKKFLCFRIWYGRAGWYGEKSLAIGICKHDMYDRIRYALCFCLIWVWCNIGFERKCKEKE